MDFGNLILFWFLGGLALMVLNFVLFQFSFVRKLIYITSSILLISTGSVLGDLMKEHAVYIGGSTLSWNNSDIDTMVVTSTILLIFVFLMSFGDSLLDFEETSDYDVSVFALFGIYFLNVSDKNVETSEFITYYMIASVLSLIVYYVGFFWFEWFYIFNIIGWIALGYSLVLKPLFLKLSSN